MQSFDPFGFPDFGAGGEYPSGVDYEAIEAQLRDALGIGDEEASGIPSSTFTLKMQNAVRHILGLYKGQITDSEGVLNLTGEELQLFYEAAGKWAAWQYAASPAGRIAVSGMIEVETGPVKRKIDAGSADTFIAGLRQSAYAALRLIGGIAGGFSTASRLARSGAWVAAGDRAPRSIVEAAYGPSDSCRDGAVVDDERLGYGNVCA